MTRDEKINEWRLLLKERKEKGLTVKEYCKEKNITLSQFYYYQEIINKPKQSQEYVQKQKAKQSAIQPIKIINSTPKENVVIKFILPNNLQCIFPIEMPSHEIKAILELVISCC